MLKRNDSQVNYFGFYASAYDKEYIDQVKNFSNLVHIDHSAGNIPYIIDALKKAKRNQMSAIVSIHNIFYDCSGWNCEFKNNSESFSKWVHLRDEIKSADLVSTIFSFYTDEPEMYARIRESKAVSRGENLKIDIIAELESIASLIKSDFPNVKLQMTSSYYDVHQKMVLPRGFDIFGLDCYNGWELCGSGNVKKSIPEYYAILNQKIDELENADSKPRFLALLPPSFYVDGASSDEYPTKEVALELFIKYLDFSKTNPRIIAIIPFLWPQQIENGKILHGASEFVEFQDLVSTYFSGFFKPHPLTCESRIEPVNSISLNCDSGYYGERIKNRSVICQDSEWFTSEWKTVLENCTQIVIPKPPLTPSPIPLPEPTTPPTVPTILRGGLGCEDNLCLWVISNSLSDNFRVIVRDPKNFGNFVNINFSHGLLKRQLADGTQSVSLRIPIEMLPIYTDRGLDIVLVNIINGTEAMFAYSFSKP